MNQEKKYRYDPDTCCFVEVEESLVERARHHSWTVALALVVALGLGWAMDAHVIQTPTEQALDSENAELQKQLERASAQLEVLSEEVEMLAERDAEVYRTLLEVEPISDDIRQVGVGGADQYQAFDRFDEDTATLLRETASMLDEIERQVGLQEASYRELMRYAQEREERLAQLPVLRPLNTHIVSGYGYRTDPILGVQRMHSGVDFAARMGTPVKAPADGVVDEFTYSSSYGHYIDLRHPKAGYITRYAHLSEAADNLREGMSVERGEVIGYTGNSGRSTGPHLHYEVHEIDGGTVNPMDLFLPDMNPKKYAELVEREKARNRTSGSAQNDMLSDPVISFHE